MPNTLRKILFTCAALLAVGMPMTTTGAQAAEQSVPYTIATLTNQNTGLCLDDSSGYGLRAISCNGLDYQKWKEFLDSSDAKVFQNVHTGRCVDDSSAYGLRSFPCNGEVYQEWGWVIHSDESETFRSAATSECLDDSFGYGLRGWPCNGSVRLSMPGPLRQPGKGLPGGKLAIGSGATAVARTMGARWCRTGSWRRSGRR